jgi:hypothetical protein
MINWQLRFGLGLSVIVQAGCVAPAPVKVPVRVTATRVVKVAHAKPVHPRRLTKLACPVPRGKTLGKALHRQSSVDMVTAASAGPPARYSPVAAASPIVFQTPVPAKAVAMPSSMSVCEASFPAGCCAVTFCATPAH